MAPWLRLCLPALAAVDVLSAYRLMRHGGSRLESEGSARATDGDVWATVVSASEAVPRLPETLAGEPVKLLDASTFQEFGAFYYLRDAQHGVFATFPYDFFVSSSLFVNGVWAEAQVRAVVLNHGKEESVAPHWFQPFGEVVVSCQAGW